MSSRALNRERSGRAYSVGSRDASTSGGALGVSLDTLVLRYIVGHRLLGEFASDEADRAGYSSHGHALQQLRRVQEALLERITATIASEYQQERERMERSPEQCRRELIQKLLAGEPVDSTKLNYEFDLWHLGVIAMGNGAERVVGDLANGLGYRHLAVVCGEGTCWAWLGGQCEPAVADVERLLPAEESLNVQLAIGEPHRGIDGWRLTHREAQAALPVALSRSQMLTRCADVPLEAALLQQELLAGLLVKNYLSPLNSQKDGGVVLRKRYAPISPRSAMRPRPASPSKWTGTPSGGGCIRSRRRLAA